MFPEHSPVLEEYHNDPRTVDNLIDGVNLTSDDLHSWLTPFTSGKKHFVFLEFDEPVTISMIRIWNYNKSRIHAYRGARYVELSLDGRNIFEGELRMAPGSHALADVEECAEKLLFTTSLG